METGAQPKERTWPGETVRGRSAGRSGRSAADGGTVSKSKGPEMGKRLSRGAGGPQVPRAGGRCRPASGPRALASRLRLPQAAALQRAGLRVNAEAEAEPGRDSRSPRPDCSEPGMWAPVSRGQTGQTQTSAREAGGASCCVSLGRPGCPPQVRTRGTRAPRPSRGTCL